MLPNQHFTNLQITVNRTLLDLCKLLTHTEGATNDYGYATETYSEDIAYTPCGFAYLRMDESTFTAYEAPEAEASLRLAAGTDITNVDRVLLTHKQGIELDTPLTFDVVGEPKVQRTGVTLLLKAANEL